MVDLGRDIGFPHWVFGESCFAFLDGGARRVRRTSRTGSTASASGPADGDDRRRSTLPYTVDRRADGAAARRSRFVGASPTTEAHVVTVDVDGADGRADPVASSCRRATSAVDVGVVLGARAGRLPDRRRRRPPTPCSTAPRNPDVGGSRRRAPAAARRDPRRADVGGPGDAAPRRTSTGRSRGFAVVDVNYRGSTGYGRAYRDLLRGQWGVVDVEDCAAVVPASSSSGATSTRDRLCIRGGSAGGFTTLAALAFEDVFAAGASYYGVADLGALATDTHKFESRYLDGLIGPWPEARDVYEARSPINHVDAIDRPLVVFQGLEDEVVPPNAVGDDRRRRAGQGRPRRVP